MLGYRDYKTPAEFDAGYANNIDAAVVACWEAFFRERALRSPPLGLNSLTVRTSATRSTSSRP